MIIMSHMVMIMVAWCKRRSNALLEKKKEKKREREENVET